MHERMALRLAEWHVFLFAWKVREGISVDVLVLDVAPYGTNAGVSSQTVSGIGCQVK
jgi:hypothetical protein